MTTNYVADVFSVTNTEAFSARWLARIQPLRSRGLISAELFIKTQDIRESSGYAAMSLLAVQDTLCPDGIPWFTELSLNEHTTRVFCSLNTALNISDAEDDVSSVWLINPFEITLAERSDVISMWNNARDALLDKKGLMNARLFQSEVNAKYNLFNIAQWSSADAIHSALNHSDYSSHREKSQQYILHPSLCVRKYHLIGDTTHE
ncbi:hypothetical protein ACIQCT_22840 [Enterobacter cancerogenus]|uniref:hypothetical protein n=1 Tax=Enterobacter cancerogenus TaxID=69218 RepID=UPI0038290CF9